MHGPRPAKAYSYTRFSIPEQAKGDSATRQALAAQRWAEQHEVELDTELTFRDEGVSAFEGMNAERGALGEFLRALRTYELCVADRVFQWRLPKKNWFEDERHTQELVRVISEHKKPLDPILVTAIGKKFYVVDGHHRVDAYSTVGWTRPVPVEYFEGSLNEARVEAFKRNSKNKLSMTREDKLEGAWRLVKEGEHTQVQIAAITTVAVRTISTMGSTLRKYGERVAKLPWSRARGFKLSDEEEIPHEDWMEREAQKLAKQLLRNVGPRFVKSPDITARALEIISPAFPAAL